MARKTRAQKIFEISMKANQERIDNMVSTAIDVAEKAAQARKFEAQYDYGRMTDPQIVGQVIKALENQGFDIEENVTNGYLTLAWAGAGPEPQTNHKRRVA